MSNFLITEETIHYAARFMERWAEKCPNKEHDKMSKEMRKFSDHLLDNLYQPMFITVVRAKTK